MKIQLINTYLKLMDEGLVPYIRCGSDATHDRPFVRPIDWDNDDPGYEMWCTACSWRWIIGIRDYEHMKNILEMHGYFDD